MSFSRGVFDRPIAEFVLGAVLAHAKRVHESHELQREHAWRHRETRSVPGARAVVVGTGGIGREIVRLLLAALPAHAHVVNVGRGPTVVEQDLLAALHTRSLDGATLDVFETEPLPPGSPVWDAPGLVVSAHMSGDVVGWRATLARQFMDNARRWLDGEPLLNVVDKQLGYVPGGTG